MVITMNNEAVNIYNMSETQYEKYLADGTDEYRIKKYCVKSIPKKEYSCALLKGDASHATAYYYDNGTTMVKKSIKKIDELSYYSSSDGELWPSREYYNYKKSNKNRVFPLNRELTELDYKLNNSVHVDQLFQDDLLDEFKLYYDSSDKNNHRDKILAGKYYNVLSYVKLILNPAKTDRSSLTANKLKGYLCLIVTPIGMTSDGEIKYSIVEFPLKNYTNKIQSEFTIILHENNKSAKNLKPDERFDFLESAAIRVIHSIQDEILERTNSVIFNGNGITWKEYCDKFLIKYKYDLCNFNIDKWKIYMDTLVDSRTVHNGYIVPLVIEHEHLVAESDKKIESVSNMNNDELLKPETSVEVDNVEQLKPMFKLDDIALEPYIISDSLESDTYIPDDDIDHDYTYFSMPSNDDVVADDIDHDYTYFNVTSDYVPSSSNDEQFDISNFTIKHYDFDSLPGINEEYISNNEVPMESSSRFINYDFESLFRNSLSRDDVIEVGGRQM